ncbi:hypothetical protein M378DRAFT_168296 [Amanita muscaria Koide BX008]|uniref:Uncharacterized protein n=1 Tax=Amanita muscaria (strain Koide BX008) TaxID=946122 RepID=A0A0C2SBP7_AMAMK|nr:hypothetical protein M378DRAFT_168296 [Amanita muscaria Koide BX008]
MKSVVQARFLPTRRHFPHGLGAILEIYKSGQSKSVKNVGNPKPYSVEILRNVQVAGKML